MPSVSVTLPDVSQSVSRPVIFQIIQQVFQITRLSGDTKILYNDDSDRALIPGTSIDDKGYREIRTGSERITFVEVQEEKDKNTLQETQTHSTANPPIFLDPHVQLSIRPIYITSNVTINIRYRCNSKTEAERWLSDMFIRASRGRDLNLHDVTCGYTLPPRFLSVIKEVWERREKVAPYGHSLDTYFKMHATDQFTLLSNRAGENVILSVSMKQIQIQGFFEFDGLPSKPTRDEETGTWEIAFSYRFSYQKPEACYLHFPIMVHNQLMPENYIRHTVLDYEQHPQEYDRYWRSLSMFEHSKRADVTRPASTYFRLPRFDDFWIDTVPSYTGTVFTALCQVEDDQRTLLDLHNLGELVMDADVLDFLRTEAPFVTKIYLSFIHVALYRDNALTSDGTIEVTPEGIVRAVENLDLRKQYRVRVAIMPKINWVNQSAIDRLRNHPKAFVKILAAMNEVLLVNPDYVDLGNRQRIEDYEFLPIYRLLTGMESDQKESMINQSLPSFDGRPNGHLYLGQENSIYGIPPNVLKYWFKLKRRMRTVMNVGILVYPRTVASYRDSYLIDRSRFFVKA